VRRLPFQLRSDTITALRCTNCGRLLRRDSSIIVETCCVNSSPWVFCGKECYRQFMVKWVRNQDAVRSGGKLRVTL